MYLVMYSVPGMLGNITSLDIYFIRLPLVVINEYNKYSPTLKMDRVGLLPGPESQIRVLNQVLAVDLISSIRSHFNTCVIKCTTSFNHVIDILDTSGFIA